MLTQHYKSYDMYSWHMPTYYVFTSNNSTKITRHDEWHLKDGTSIYFLHIGGKAIPIIFKGRLLVLPRAESQTHECTNG